jgi:polyhydroxybutyrate depolymerase
MLHAVRKPLTAVAGCFVLLFAGCSKDADPAPSSLSDAGDDAPPSGVTVGGTRPVTVRVPAGYDASRPAPLVVMLHGYSSNPGLTELYFKMSGLADAHGFFYVAPLGTLDHLQNRFWNATDACCDVDGKGVDDVAYLTSVVKEVQAAYAIDPRRIYVMGHSNGGFMTHRLACDRADVFAAGASFAGAVWADPEKCRPSAPVGILEINGTKDEDVVYAGTVPAAADGGADAGATAPPPGSYPGAEETVRIWASKNGCAEATTDGGRLHVTSDGHGAETVVTRHDACRANGAAELWTIPDAPHVIVFTPESLEAIWKFFEAHAKPQ